MQALMKKNRATLATVPVWITPEVYLITIFFAYLELNEFKHPLDL
jgi:hypothetical protein